MTESAFGIEHGEVSKAQFGPFTVTYNSKRAVKARLKRANAARRVGSQQANAARGTAIREGTINAGKKVGGAFKSIPDVKLRDIGHAASKPGVMAGEAMVRHPAAVGTAAIAGGIGGAGYGAFKIGQRHENKKRMGLQ